MGKIMIVDDSKMTRDFHAYILRSAKYEIIEAFDGADAIEKLIKNDDIVCIITDINMPIMDGLTMLKKIRTMEGYEKLPVIVITTIDRPEERMEALKAGASFYLNKPIKPSVLLASVKMVLGEGKGG
ncbi:response regulator [Fervidobacterium sp.]